MLIRHGWLAPLLKPPTINEDEEAEAAAEAGHDSATGEALPETADKEVADWVKSAIERKISGKMATSEKPALHAAPLDAVPRSPMVPKDSEGSVSAVNGPATSEAVSHIAPGEAVQVESPELKMTQAESIDVAGCAGGTEDAAAAAAAAGQTAEP
jgi:hypothetical protein